jgi:hypothetical protein
VREHLPKHLVFDADSAQCRRPLTLLGRAAGRARNPATLPVSTSTATILAERLA